MESLTDANKDQRARVCELCAAPSVHFRGCRDCDYVVGRCAEHGARKGVSRTMHLHRQREHGVQLQIFGTATAVDPVLELARPKTRADCEPCKVCQVYADAEVVPDVLPCGHKREESANHCRPCPWASCRHHALIEIAQHDPRVDESGNVRDARPTTIRLNRTPEPGVLGRRPGLAASDDTNTVQAWIEDAVEHLSEMPDTCSLDVADANPDGTPLVSVANLLGVTTAAIKEEVEPAADKLRAGLQEYRDHAPGDHAGLLARAQER